MSFQHSPCGHCRKLADWDNVIRLVKTGEVLQYDAEASILIWVLLLALNYVLPWAHGAVGNFVCIAAIMLFAISNLAHSGPLWPRCGTLFAQMATICWIEGFQSPIGTDQMSTAAAKKGVETMCFGILWTMCFEFLGQCGSGSRGQWGRETFTFVLCVLFQDLSSTYFSIHTRLINECLNEKLKNYGV